MRDSSKAVQWSRRQALKVGAATSLVPLGCREPGKADTGPSDSGVAERSPEPDTWDPGGTEDADRFPFGVQVGDVTSGSAVVHLRTFSTPVTMVLAEARGDAWEEVDRQENLSVRTLPVTADPVGMAVVVPLDGLSADTAYSVVFFDGDARSVVARFRTALAEGATRRVVFGTTSCFGGNQPWPSLFFAADEKLDFFGLLGDTVYADGSRTAADYRAFWDDALSTEGLIRLTASTSIIATWDDHEVDNNWKMADLGEERFGIAKACFDEALPRTEGPGGTGVWRVLRWGAALDVFVLDGRAERDADQGHYLSPAQYDWLVQGLQASTARFKIVFNSVPITDLTAIFSTFGAEDRWDGFAEQRSALLEAIADIEGLLFITGDVHYAQVGYVDPAGGVAENLIEVFTGPVGSFTNPGAELFTGDPQYIWMSMHWNWCRFDCDPDAGTIRVTHIGDEGDIQNDITLSL
jgi:alkaline phosphatase D